jgi:pectate lyase
MSFKRNTTAALIMLALSGGAFAASYTGGFSTADGNASSARKFTAKSHTEIQAIIDAARYDDAGKKVSTGAYPIHIVYTGNEDTLINQIVKDHTVGSDGSCPKAHWGDEYRKVEVKNFTAGVTIEGANGSSANFGIVLNGGTDNVVVKNMKIGALGGASNDADMIRIDSATNIWIDHNELFAVNNECKGSPDGDLTFESAIDIKKDSQNITVSYNVIRDSKKVGLDGSSASDIGGGRKITFHHNVYSNVNGRLPLQRGGWIHVYNNFYDQITGSGINVRTGGMALIEKNWFQNSKNPVTCRFDTKNCGKWDLRGNNVTSAASNAAYGISWDDPGAGGINADSWTSTGTFNLTLPYSYEPVSPDCVKSKLASYAGVGKNGAQLTAAACVGGSSSSSSSKSSSSSSVSSSSSSVSSSVSSSSSSVSSSKSSSSSSSVSSSSSSSGSGVPALKGTGDYPNNFSKCSDEGKVCTPKRGTGWVAFGRKGNWVAKYVGVGKSITCSVSAFGSDPKGNPNKCAFQN